MRATGLFNSLLADAPFVVADSVFANPIYRGYRLPPVAATSLAKRRDMFIRQRIRIHDARLQKPPPSLEHEGFQLVESPTFMDFGNPELIRTRFYEYCSSLVKAATGCLQAYVVQHEFRTGLASAESYAQTVHADVCPYIENVVDPPGKHHFGLYNVWRSIDPEREIELMPLALCDIKTVAAGDIVYADAWRRTEPPTRLVDCRLIHEAGQGWRYFPRMTPDECLLLKQYDTRENDAGLRACFHTAFADPATPAGAPPRQTVEARVLAIFAKCDEERESRRAKFEASVPTRRRDGSVSDWRHEEMIDWRGDATMKRNWK